MKKGIWQDFKWLLNYMATVIMYTIIVILLLIGVVLMVYFADLTLQKNRTEWKAPIYGAYVILSGSMEPTIMTGDAIIIRRASVDNLKVGDIVTYKSYDPSRYGIMITHRIIDINNEDGTTAYVTKGDSKSNTRDPLLVKPEQVYGKVVMVIPKIGYIQVFLATKFGWIIAVVLPCVGIIIYDLIKLIKKIRKNNRKEKRKEAMPHE